MKLIGRQSTKVMALGLLAVTPVFPQVNTKAGPPEVRATQGFKPGQVRTWFFWSFLPEGDQAETLGLEFENYIDIGKIHVKNITYFEVNQYPRPIPGQPSGNPEPGVKLSNGINDILSGFWISSKGGHHGHHHLSFGPVFSLRTASSDSLGSGKWSIGPTIDYEYSAGRLFAGSIVLNLFSFAGDKNRKDVNYFMAKPFVIYQLAEKWDLLYMPYGVSIYWNKPKSERAYVPLGGGIQRHLRLGALPMNVSAQLFNNVIRPSKGTEWDLRFMLEFVLN